jgi:hypothetical protein
MSIVKYEIWTKKCGHEYSSFSSSPPTNPISGERPVRSTAFDQKLLSYSCKDIDVWRIEISKSMDEMVGGTDQISNWPFS